MWYIIIGIIIAALIIWSIIKKRSETKVEANPLEKYLNQEAIVTESISDTIGTGKVKIDGEEFRARRGAPGVIKPAPRL